MVASPFLRIQEDTEPLRVIPPRSLRPSDFLVGNPGIQGSNLVCRLSALLEAGLFDESLPSCTDRGLCNRTPQDPAPMPGKLRELLASGAVDVAIGACTGAPPLPFAPTERVQLVDPVAPLQWFSVLDPNEVLSDRSRGNATLRSGRFITAGLTKSAHLDREMSAPAPSTNPTTTAPILRQQRQSTGYPTYPRILPDDG